MADFAFSLNEDHQQVQKWLHEFAENVIRPVAAEYDEREEFPWPVVKEAAKAGIYSPDFFMQMAADETGISLPLVMEELFWGDAGIGLALVGSLLPAVTILGSGTPEQIMEWGPRLYGTPEEPAVAALCASEPESGSDVSNMKTRAVYDEKTDEWVLNGVKTWITNGGIADVHVVVATVDPELRSRGHASFVIGSEHKGKGLRQGQKFAKHGIRASHTAEVILEDLRLPGSALLGGKEKLDAKLAHVREGKSTRSQVSMKTFEASRPSVGAQAVGVARAAYEYALDYSRKREQFGRPIGSRQAIGFMLADMKTRIDAARLLVWRASWMGRNNIPFDNGEGSMSKLYAGETAVDVTEKAIQILGGNGYTREYPVERWHRDAKIYTIFEGTSEMQRLVISRSITGLRVD